MALVYSWTAPFPDGWKAKLNGLEFVCGNVFGHHVDFRNWRIPPRVRALGPGRDWSWLDTSRRIVTMQVPQNNAEAFRYEAHIDAFPVQNHTGDDDPRLVAANEFVADGTGFWASYYDAARRIVVNGAIVHQGQAGGVVASAGEFATKRNFATIAVYSMHTGALVREYVPQGTFNGITLDDGWIGHGYSGDAHVISREGARWVVNVFHESKEGVPRVKTGPDGRKWVFTSIDFADKTHSILCRPVGEQECIEVEGVGFADFSVAYDDELRRFVFAGNGDTGALQLLAVDADAERRRVYPRVAALSRKAFFGGFYATTDRYPETITDYPQNCEVIVEPGAVARSTVPVIVSPDAIAGIRDPSRVLGIYVAQETTASGAAIDAEADHAREVWRQAFPSVPVPPVVGYLTSGMVTRPGWPPKRLDVYAPELYMSGDDYSSRALWRLYDEWVAVLPMTRPWMPAGQAYDRNEPRPDRMKLLAGISPTYIEIVDENPFVIGLLMFAVNRIGLKDGKPIGGVVVYPELLPVHRRMFAAIPGAPAKLPTTVDPGPGPDPDPDPDPDPGGDMLKVHMGDYAKTGKVGEPATVKFRIESDHPVTLVRVDLRRDGKPGLGLRPTEELPDLRRLRGVDIEMETAGNFSWHVRAENGVDDPDESQSERTIVVAR